VTSVVRRRRVWRWALAVWAVTVLVGGGLTLWLQDAAAPQQPAGRENQHSPAPLLSFDEDSRPSCPGAADGAAVLCAYATSR